jgi:hypothetical protein
MRVVLRPTYNSMRAQYSSKKRNTHAQRVRERETAHVYMRTLTLIRHAIIAATRHNFEVSRLVGYATNTLWCTTGAAAPLTNLLTILHNILGYEFSKDKKPFCKSQTRSNRHFCNGVNSGQAMSLIYSANRIIDTVAVHESNCKLVVRLQ